MFIKLHPQTKTHLLFLLVFLLSGFGFNTSLAQQSDVVSIQSLNLNKSLDDFTVEYLEEQQGISILNFTGNYDRDIDSVYNAEARQAVLQEFYQNQEDIYDFIYIFTEFEFETGDAKAFQFSLDNEVFGIGKEIFDFSQSFFSENLSSIIDMAALSRNEFNPSKARNDHLLGLMMHETMHYWGVSVKYRDSSNLVSDRLLGRDDSHWSYFLNSNASVMYGSLWQETSTGHFKTIDIQHGLNSLDLYLTGFIAKESVADFFVINDASSGTNTDIPPPIGTEIEGTKEIISVDDIIAHEGERIPNNQDSQHNFKVKFILLKTTDQEINTQSIANLYVLQKEFQKRFFAETRGIGTIEFQNNLSNIDISHPATLDFDPQLNSTFDIQSAVDFLLIDTSTDWWQDKIATKVRDTVTTIKSLQLIINDYPEAQTKLSNAILWLNNYQPQNNDEIAWMLSSGVLTNEVEQSLLVAINNNEIPSGGWGIDTEVNASSYDTALVINGLLQATDGNLNLGAATTQFVLDNINQDSGYSYTVGGKSSVASSALLMKSIDEISNDSQYKIEMADYLVSQKLPDNSYGGNGTGTPHETAVVIMALESMNNSNYQAPIDFAKNALDAMQSVDGSMQGSVYSTALAIKVFNTNTKANLSFNNVHVSNTNVIAGEQILINSELANSGVVDANNIELTLYKDTVDSTNIIGQTVIPLLIPDQSLNESIIIDTTGFNQSTEVLVVIDVNNSIDENNEDDNLFTFTLNVQQPSSQPELAFIVDAFVISPDQFDALPVAITANATVVNLSLSDTDNVTVSLYKQESNNDLTLLATETQSINTLTTQEFSFIAEITQANLDIPLVFKIDPENTISEVNEENNSYSALISKVQSVDIAITAQDVSLPSQAVIGVPLNITFSFRNLGTELSSSFDVKVYADHDSSSLLIFEAQISEMAAGEQINRVFDWTPQTEGDYSIRFVIDESNQLAETNESNNEVTLPLQVVANALSNLLIEDGDVIMSPDPGLQGQDLQFSLTIHNNSSSVSGVFDATIYQQMPTGIPNRLIATKTNIASITANSSAIILIDILATNLRHDHTFIFEIDSSQTITEFNEDDNIVIKEFTILSKPDAFISAGSFQLTPSIPVLDESLTVDVAIQNLGQQDINQLSVSLYYDNSQQTNPVLVESQDITTLNGGQSQQVTFTFNYPNDNNIDALIVILDEQNTIDEGNESNNQAEIIVGNQDAILYVTQRYFSPNSDGVKDNTSIVFNTETIADYKIEVLDVDFNLIKSFDSPLFVNTTFGDVTWDGLNDRGVLARDGDYIVQLLNNNSTIVASTIVSLDNNKSPIFDSIATKNGYLTDINCLGNFQNSTFKYSHDGEHLYTTVYKDFDNIQHRGLFKIKADGSKLSLELSPQFLTGVNSLDYHILDNGDILMRFSQDSLYKTYLKEIDTGTLILLDSRATSTSSSLFTYTSDFVILYGLSEKKLTKIYYDTSVANQEIQFDDFLSRKLPLKNGLIISQYAPDNERDLYFVSYDFTQEPLLLDSGYDGNEDAALLDSKNISTDFRNYVYRKDQAIKLYKTNNNNLELVFSKQIGLHDNFGFNSHNEFFLLNQDQQIEVYNSSGIKLLQSEPTYNLDDFNLEGIESVSVDLGGEGAISFAISEMFDPFIQQEVIAYNDYTDQKELLLLVKNSLIGQFITPPCDDIGISCFEWQEITQAPVVSVFSLVRINYNDVAHVNLEVTEIGIFDFYSTAIKFFPLQEGRSQFAVGEIFLNQKGLIDRANLQDKVQITNEFSQAIISKSFPKAIETNGNGLSYVVSKKIKQVEVFESLLLRDGNSLINSECGSLNSKYIYRSRNNLYADLSIINQQNGIQISATAFDQNFASYELHWSNVNSPNQWNFIHSANQSPTDGDIVYNWLPNQNGAFTVKLTAIDKAGNTYSDSEQVFINSPTSAIRQIDVSPKFFSPNGDSIKDDLLIQYEVLAATEVLIEIEDETGLIVRTFEKEYINPVASDLTIWDGRDENGILMPDGKYQVIVQGFRFDIYLDTLSIVINGLDMSFSMEPIATRLNFINDDVEEDIIQRQDYLNHAFQFYNQTTGLWQDTNSTTIVLHSDSLIETFNNTYRLKTEDKAGNIGVSAVNIPDNKFWQTSIRKILTFGIDSYVIQYRKFPTEIKECLTSNNGPTLVEWVVSDKLAFALQALSYDDIEFIRLRTSYFDSATQQFISHSKLVNALSPNLAQEYIGNSYIGSNSHGNNLFDVSIDGTQVPLLLVELQESDFPETDAQIEVNFEISLVSNPEPIISKSCIQFSPAGGGLDTTDIIKLTFDETIDLANLSSNAQIPYENFINTVPQNRDLEYYWLYIDQKATINNNALIETKDNGEINVYTPDSIDDQDTSYSVFFVIPKSGCRVKKSILWTAENFLGGPIQSDRLIVNNNFCITPELEAFFYMGEFCNNASVNNPIIKFEITADEINPQSNLPFLVELYHKTSDGSDELIYADTNPQFTTNSDNSLLYTNTIDYDTSQLINGSHKFKVIMSDLSGEVVMEKITIPLDTFTANNQFNNPNAGTHFCASEEVPGNVDVEIGANVSLSSPYFAQLHVILGSNTITENEIIYQAYNNFDTLVNLDAQLEFTKRINVPLYNDQATLVLETFNSSGVSYCSNVDVSLDSLVDYNLTYSALDHTILNGKSYISPNADGAKDTLKLIALEANEALDITIKLNEADNSNISLGVITSSSLIANEIEEFNWDGELNGGVVADGEYTIVIDLVDTCGLINTIKIPVIVDTIQPINTFVSPIDAGSLNIIQRVVFTIEDENLGGTSLSEFGPVEYFYNNVWNQLELLSSNFNDQTGLLELQLDWNLTNLPPAIYPLRVTSLDLAGNVGVTTINPELINQQDIFWNYTLSPLYISPNADTIQDNVVIEFGLNLESIISINILDNNQIVVRSLVTEQNFPAQSNQLLFNGLNDSQIVLPDGVYTIEIIANEAANLTNSATLQLPITIDNQAPIIQWLPPLSNIAKGEGTAQLMFDELYPASLQVNNQQLTPLEATVSVLNTNQSGTFNLFDLASLNETQYQLSATAIDLAGNRTTESLSYLIDKTPPEIELTTPLNDAFVGGLAAQISIAGNIIEDNFEHYELALSPNSEPFVWQAIHTSIELTDSQFDYQWLSAVNDDAYLLRLTAYDQAGWVTEASHVIIMDKTPPQALIIQPLNDALVGTSSEIHGTAIDENFDFYSLSYKQSTSDTWTLFTINQSPVSTSLLGTLPESLASGSYDIKLITQDKIALTSEFQISIIIDIEPPPTPVNLTLEIINNQVSLNWQTVSANDLDGYLIHRNGQQLLAQPLIETTYLDTTVTDGDYTYTVSAIDTIGNISQPSNQVIATIDTTPPEVSIVTPVANQRVNHTVEIIGTALSLLDFNNYKLYYRQVAQGPPGTLIHQSTLPVSLDLLGLFDSTIVAQEQDYIIRLEATDHSNNTAISEQTVYVDNSAPNAPINLTHQLQGQTSVLLQWSANNETDLVGYLVFQNGVVVSGSGDGNPSIANAITATNFTIANLVDGTHDFTIAAIDQTGNISQFSNTVSETINSRAPDTIITTPVDAARFEAPILIEATSPDNDIADIKFEYSIDNVNWIELSIDQQQPFQTTLNPVTLSLTFGNLYLRATATDTGSQVDSTPAQVTVEYADLTAPLAVENATVNIDGGEITLSWDANNEADLQGYLIYRTIDGITTELTASAITVTNYSDINLPDGIYSYQISAIDNADNESSKIQVDNLQVFSISIVQPYSPLLIPNHVQLNGQTLRSDGVINTLMQNGSGNTQLADILVNSDNTFISSVIDLETGLNSFTATHTLSTNHTSKTSTVQLELSPIPQIPTNLQVNVVGLTSELSWDTTVDTFAYLPYRNGQPIHPVENVTNIIAYLASSSQSFASRVGDNNLSTFWRPSFSDMTDESPTFIEITLDQPQWITEVELTWYESSTTIFEPSHYDIQYFSSVGWVTVKEFDANNQTVVTNVTDIPYLTDRVRLVIRNPQSVYEDIRLSEFILKHQPLTGQNTLSQVEVDGTYSYQVSSINNYGFESGLSDTVVVDIGDTTAPETIILSGNLSGNNDVSLAWEASVSTDVSSYWLFREQELILITADETILNYTDTGLINGQYDYTIKAVDAAGNSSESSNTVTIDVQQQDLPIPQELRIFALLSGNAAQLNWDAVSSGRLHHYDIYRSLVSSGPYSKIGETMGAEFVDSTLENSISYYYVVTTVDEFNNASDYSNEVVVIPTDSLPASTPVITYPTIFDNPITINQIMSDVSGFSDVGVLIDLYHNDNYTRTVTSATEYSVSTQELTNLSKFNLNKNGQYNAYSNFSGQFILQDKISGDEISVDMSIDNYSWNNDGTLMYVTQVDLMNGGRKLSTYDLELNEVAVVLNESSINNVIPSPDDTKVFYRGQYTDPQTMISTDGVWLFDRVTSTALEIPLVVSPQLSNHRIVWSPNNQYVAFINTTSGGEFYLYNIGSQTLEVIATDFAFNATLDWSQNGDTLLYGRGTTDTQLYTYDLNTNASTALPATGDSYKYVNYSPDESQIVYLQGCCDVGIYDITNQSSEIIHHNTKTIQSLVWNQQIGIEFWHYRQYNRFVSPGDFTFEDVILDSGLNQFHAIARDSSGIPSSPSLPISVTVDSTGLADISVVGNDLLISPTSALQGSSFVASVLVKNNSDQIIIDAGIMVSVSLPDSSVEVIDLLQNTISLQPFSSQAVFIDIGIREMIGEYIVQVIVDGENQIEEFNEHNNRANQTFSVLENLNPVVQVFVAPQLVAPNQPVAINIDVFNPSEVFDGKICLTIKDVNGFPVANTIEFPINQLANNATQEINYSWQTQDILSGVYQVETVLKASNGNEIIHLDNSVEIFSVVEFSISLDTQSNLITEGENLLFTSAINYTDGNTPQNGTIIWEVSDENQQIVWTQTQTLPEMLVGFSTVINNQWPTSLIGDYQLTMYFTADNYQQTLVQPFTVISATDVVDLGGQFASNPSSIILGDDFIIDYNLTNSGDSDLVNISITIQLLSSDLSTVMASNASNLTLSIDQSTALNVLFPSTGLAVENYLLALYADLSSVGGANNQLIDTQSINAIDTIGPEITVATPQPNSLQPANIDVRYVITDLHSQISRITFQSADVNQGNEVAVNINGINNAYNQEIFNLTQGPHQLTITATDSSGNSSQQTIDFSVDPLAPVIEITGVQGNTDYNQAVTATVTIMDDNLITSEILLNNVNISSPHEITAEGSYFLSVRAQDSVGNVSFKSLNFTVDLTAPEITITYPENNTEIGQLATTITGYTNESAAIDLTIAAYSDQVSTDNTGFFRFIDVPLQLGANTVDLSATDSASNQSIVTTLNIIAINQVDIAGQLDANVNFAFEPDLILGYSLTNNTVNDFNALDAKIEIFHLLTHQLVEEQIETVELLASQSINSDLLFTSPDLLAGSYQVILSVFESGQWLQKAEKTINLFRAEFGIHVNLPLAGQVYNAEIITSVDTTEIFSIPPDVQYRLDDSEIWVSMVNTQDENYIANLTLDNGTHVIQYRINDGNNQNQQFTTIAFDIDTLAPEITVINPTNGLITNQDVILDFSATDDHDFSLLAQLNAIDVASGQTITSEGEYTLNITATDSVNNQANDSLQFIIDKTNPTITLTNVVDNQQIIVNGLSITGTTEPFASLTLDFATSHYDTNANDLGEFSFDNVVLNLGENDLLFKAIDRANNHSEPLPITLNFSEIEVCSLFGFKSASGYNAFVFNDYTAGNSLVQGRLAAGNNINIDNYYIGENLIPAQAGDALIAGGNINFAHQQLYYGNILAAGQANIGQIVIDNMQAGAQITSNALLPLDFDQSYQELRLLSNALAEETQNSTYVINSQILQLQGDCAAELQVYNINPADLENVQSFDYTCLGENAYLVLNVDGESIRLSGIDLDILAPIQQRIIWNFHQAQELVMDTINIQGSILAVDAHVADHNDVIFKNSFEGQTYYLNGQLIAGSFNSPIQMNHQPLICNDTIQVNAAPIVVDQTLVTNVNTPLLIPLSIMDENMASLQYLILNQVSSGQLTGSLPSLTYIPEIDFVGTVNFTYQVTDQYGKISSATITIEIGDDMIFMNGFEVTAKTLSLFSPSTMITQVAIALVHTILWRRK